MSNEACKVFNAMSTSLLVRVLVERTVQQFLFKEGAYFLTSFGGRGSLMPVAHSTHALPMSVNLVMVKFRGTVMVNCVWDPGISSQTMHRNGLMETTEAYLLLGFIEAHIYNSRPHNDSQYQSFICATIFLPISERRATVVILYGQDNIELQWSVSSQRNLRKMAFNMSTVGAKTLSPTVSRELVLFETNSLFQIVLKSTMSLKELLGAWGDNNLIFEELIEQQNVPTDQCAYWWCLTMIYIFIDHISFWIDICTFECIVVTIQLTRIVTCKWLMVAQPIKLVQEYNDILLISERIDEKRAIAIVVALNLKDKVLIGDGSIVMNQPQPDRNFNITKSVIGPKRLIWDPGPISD
ncbi:hypothetical protein KY284_020067 [Solanum tuberosum]|nr:hypothetical protein KY284_020067 [Solanum tuberosum]